MNKTDFNYRGRVKTHYKPRVKYQENYNNGNTSLVYRYKKMYQPKIAQGQSVYCCKPDKKIVEVENSNNNIEFKLNEDQTINDFSHIICWDKPNLLSDDKENNIVVTSLLKEHEILKSGTYSIILSMDIYSDRKCNDVAEMGIFSDDNDALFNLTDHEFTFEIWSYFGSTLEKKKLYSQNIYLNGSESKKALSVNIIRKLNFCEKIYYSIVKNDSRSLKIKKSETNLEYVLIDEDTIVKNQILNINNDFYKDRLLVNQIIEVKVNSNWVVGEIKEINDDKSYTIKYGGQIANNVKLDDIRLIEESLSLGEDNPNCYLMKWNFFENMSHQSNIIIKSNDSGVNNSEIVFKNRGGYLLILMLDLQLENECDNLVFYSMDTTTDFYNKYYITLSVNCQSKNDDEPREIHTEEVCLGGVVNKNLFKIPFHYRFAPQDRLSISLKNVENMDEDGNPINSLENIKIKKNTRFEIICLN